MLVRFELPPAANAPDDADPPPAPDANAPPGHADATVMETYRLALPAPVGEPAANAATRSFLEALEAAARPLAGLLRGQRHVEPFSPCAL